MYEDIESMTPAAGNTMPSRHRRGCSRGADIEDIFKAIDSEEILRKVATYPPRERKMWLKLLRQSPRTRF